jgi:hypothetical protein
MRFGRTAVYPDDFTALAMSGQLVSLVRFPGYAVTTDGRIWSYKTHQWLKTWIGPNRCKKWYVCFHGQNRFVHQLVLEGFRGPKPPGLVGCHNDDDPNNNNLDNLRWDTPQSNVDDRRNGGRYAKGSAHSQAKLTEEGVREIRRRKARGETLKVIAADYGVHFSIISDVIRGETWSHVK